MPLPLLHRTNAGNRRVYVTSKILLSSARRVIPCDAYTVHSAGANDRNGITSSYTRREAHLKDVSGRISNGIHSFDRKPTNHTVNVRVPPLFQTENLGWEDLAFTIDGCIDSLLNLKGAACVGSARVRALVAGISVAIVTRAKHHAEGGSQRLAENDRGFAVTLL
jgi:hypothetical protein